jgi:hypothetical protein
MKRKISENFRPKKTLSSKRMTGLSMNSVVAVEMVGSLLDGQFLHVCCFRMDYFQKVNAG